MSRLRKSARETASNSNSARKNPKGLTLLLPILLALASCSADQRVEGFRVRPTYQKVGPFDIATACIDPGPDRWARVPRFELTPEEMDQVRSDESSQRTSFMLFPDLRYDQDGYRTGPTFWRVLRDNGDQPFAILYGAALDCRTSVIVTGRVTLTPAQGAALDGPVFAATDEAVQRWIPQAIESCRDTPLSMACNAGFVEAPGSFSEGCNCAGPEVAIPSQVARVGLEVDGVPYALTFFSDRVAVDPL